MEGDLVELGECDTAERPIVLEFGALSSFYTRIITAETRAPFAA
jgi:hypothetical protein